MLGGGGGCGSVAFEVILHVFSVYSERDYTSQ